MPNHIHTSHIHTSAYTTSAGTTIWPMMPNETAQMRVQGASSSAAQAMRLCQTAGGNTLGAACMHRLRGANDIASPDMRSTARSKWRISARRQGRSVFLDSFAGLHIGLPALKTKAKVQPIGGGDPSVGTNADRNGDENTNTTIDTVAKASADAYVDENAKTSANLRVRIASLPAESPRVAPSLLAGQLPPTSWSTRFGPIPHYRPPGTSEADRSHIAKTYLLPLAEIIRAIATGMMLHRHLLFFGNTMRATASKLWGDNRYALDKSGEFLQKLSALNVTLSGNQRLTSITLVILKSMKAEEVSPREIAQIEAALESLSALRRAQTQAAERANKSLEEAGDDALESTPASATSPLDGDSDVPLAVTLAAQAVTTTKTVTAGPPARTTATYADAGIANAADVTDAPDVTDVTNAPDATQASPLKRRALDSVCRGNITQANAHSLYSADSNRQIDLSAALTWVDGVPLIWADDAAGVGSWQLLPLAPYETDIQVSANASATFLLDTHVPSGVANVAANAADGELPTTSLPTISLTLGKDGFVRWQNKKFICFDDRLHEVDRSHIDGEENIRALAVAVEGPLDGPDREGIFWGSDAERWIEGQHGFYPLLDGAARSSPHGMVHRIAFNRRPSMAEVSFDTMQRRWYVLGAHPHNAWFANVFNPANDIRVTHRLLSAHLALRLEISRRGLNDLPFLQSRNVLRMGLHTAFDALLKLTLRFQNRSALWTADEQQQLLSAWFALKRLLPAQPQWARMSLIDRQLLIAENTALFFDEFAPDFPLNGVIHQAQMTAYGMDALDQIVYKDSIVQLHWRFPSTSSVMPFASDALLYMDSPALLAEATLLGVPGMADEAQGGCDRASFAAWLYAHRAAVALISFSARGGVCSFEHAASPDEVAEIADAFLWDVVPEKASYTVSLREPVREGYR